MRYAAENLQLATAKQLQLQPGRVPPRWPMDWLSDEFRLMTGADALFIFYLFCLVLALALFAKYLMLFISYLVLPELVSK